MMQLELLSTGKAQATEEAAQTDIKLRYAEGDGRVLTARLIYSWDRGDIAAPIMSASSGPKDYIRNEIYALFEKARNVTRIVMVRKIGGVTFYLFRDASGAWFDNTGKQVIGA